MAGKAGIAYVEIKFNPGDLERMQAEAKLNGNIIADEMSQSADKNGGFFKRFISGFDEIGKGIQNTTDDFGKFISESSFANGALAPLGQTVSSLAPLLGVLTTVTTAFGAALLVLPALVAGVTFVLVALLDVVTTLAAGLAALAGPLSIVGVLLGGLGAGFVLAGQRAIKGGGVFKDFAKTVAQVEGQFHDLIYTLAQRFLPLFDRLAGAAKTALTYLGQVAKLPLKKAFESLSTTGVAMFSKFVYGVANVLKKPFRLAIEIAFGKGGQNAQTAISSWWDSLTNYLFGYTSTHPALSPNGKWLGLTTTRVNGALKPILDWFNRQHLTKTGEKWSNEIIQGFLLSNGAKNLGKWAQQTASHAGHIAGLAFKATFTAEISAIGPWLRSYWSKHWQDIETGGLPVVNTISNWIRDHIGGAFTYVVGKARAAWNTVANTAVSAFQGLAGKITGIWDQIVSYIESHVPSIHIHLPSLPGGFHIPGTAGGGTTVQSGLQWVGERGPELLNMPRGAQVIPLNKATMPPLGGAQSFDVNVYVGNEPVDARVEVAMKKTARTMTAGRKWATA